MTCSRCGIKNSRNAKYCGKCGYRFPRTEKYKHFGNSSHHRSHNHSEIEETITFDFGRSDSGLNADGSINFGGPPQRERNSRLRESYISLLEKSVPENFGVFKSNEDSEGETEDNWSDVSAPPSTPWALEQEYQINEAHERDRYLGWPYQKLNQSETEEENLEERKLVGWLVSFSHKSEGEDFRLQAGRTLIGKSPTCDIMIEDDSLGGVHASIIYEDGCCFINNEMTENELFVNGTAIKEPCALESYDEIQLGRTILKFISVNPTAQAKQKDASC
ncbi:MAG TPA: FHA domain-containing protein [Blastocatellia bacterium]|nr:FHA domain-containing protein [Blastocatellia bacterium]